MANRDKVWTLMGEAMQAFAPFYRQAMQAAIQDTGVPQNWYGLYLARGCEPEPFSVDRYQQLSPFADRESLAERLEALVAEDLMERVAPDAYCLTDPGREAVAGIFQAAHQKISALEPMSSEELEQLVDLLSRIVTATLQAPEPKDKFSLKYTRWTDPGSGAPAAVRIDQFLTDLVHYRDDAHNAAWMPYGISGTAWEALTFVWRGDAKTPEALAEALPFRGHAVDKYTEVLAELAGRGWVEEKAGEYLVTEVGGALRQKAEDKTDRYHFVGWSALSDDELGTLGELLTRLAEKLRSEAHRQIWGLMGELPRYFIGLTREVVVPLMEESGLDQPGMFGVMYRANGLAPKPITAANFAIGNPYALQASLGELLDRAAEVGLLTAVQDGEYQPTEQGKTALDAPNHAFYTRLGEIEALPAEDLTPLENLMAKIADACRDAAEPAAKPLVSIVHNGHPQTEYGPLARIDQHLDELRAFRDGVHIAAWEPYGVSGQAWEAFTFVWRNEARTAEALQERLTARGHSVETYQGVLEELTATAWLEETSEGYQLTDKGQSLRQDAEEKTDRFFFAPWATLSGGETVQIHHLLTRLRDSLKELNEGDQDEG